MGAHADHHHDRRAPGRRARLAIAAVLAASSVVAIAPPVDATGTLVPAGWVVRVNVPEAIGAKTVIGQLTVDRATDAGYVTAYACADGVPTDSHGGITRSDLNFDGRITPVASNRLIVQADADGDVCFTTSRPVDMIVDVNAVTFDVGMNSFPNRRTDTRAVSTVPGTTAPPTVTANGVVRVNVPEAAGAKTVIGQLTVDRATDAGYVTAYACADGIPTDSHGGITRSDVNYDGRITPVASNRLIVQADTNGDICFTPSTRVDLITDINAVTAVSDDGIASFPNRRTDTRAVSTVPGTTAPPTVTANGVVRVNVAEAAGAKTVIGQLTVDRATDAGYVTAYACADGIPTDSHGGTSRSDVNYDGRITPVASNRLIVQADTNGDICFTPSTRVDLITDINAVSDIGITSFPNRRTDTRSGTTTAEPPGAGPAPTWPDYDPLPALDDVAALTGQPASAAVRRRPITAVKIDNFRAARPHIGLDRADAVIEVNVEGVSRFIALYQTHLPEVGPVRSARTADLDVLAGLNRPVFGYSGANPGVTTWIDSAAGSGVLVDFTALRNPCYHRDPDRPGPHDLVLDIGCISDAAPTAWSSAGPARPLWEIDGDWTAPADAAADSTFEVRMDGVRVEWTWHPGSSRYLRAQDGEPHEAASGTQISAHNVVEIRTLHVASTVDARSPHALTVGTGDAVVHRDGVAIPATWSRSTATAPFVFRHAETGEEIPLDRGTTFIHLRRPA